jgi:nucleotidyltransferase/DNA polymerase involved in DNA repair
VRRAERQGAPLKLPDAAPADLLALKAKADAEQGGKACDSPRNTGWRPGARWARDDAEVVSRPLAGVDEATGGADACWAGETRADVARRIAGMPHHQRPPMREMGRRSEAAEMPFKRLPGDDGGKSTGWVEGDSGEYLRQYPNGLLDRPSPFTGIDPNGDERARAAIARWKEMPAIRYPGEGPRPDKHARRGSNDPGAAPPGVVPFFDTGRTTSGTLERVCREEATAPLSARGTDVSPLVTVQKVGSRIEIAAASPAAAALGIEPGMALTRARASVPALDARDADPEGDRADLERLAIALARRWCPVVAISDADGLFLDVTDVAHLHCGEAAMARRIVRLLARMGVTARVAVADTTGAAWAIARHPPHAVGRGTAPAGRGGGAPATSDAVCGNRPSTIAAQWSPSPCGGGFCVLPPGSHIAALAPLPVTALRLPEEAVELARRLGIDTVGELAAMPRAPLVRRFGRAVAARLDQASGAIVEPLDPVIPAEPIVVARRFAEPIATAEAIGHWLAGLVGELSYALAKAGQGARALVLACLRVDSETQAIRIGLARPTRDPAHLLRLLVRRIEEIEPGYGIDALELHVRRADPLGAEALGAALAGDAAPDLAPLVDTLANRIGPRRLWRTQAVESDVPERSVKPLAPLDPDGAAARALRPDDVRRLDTRPDAHPWHPRWPRPVRLLRPERIDHVLAELPDYPPARFTWRGRTHRVVRGDGPERIFGEWWRTAAERHSVRDYFQVEDEAGHRFWLFRRGDGRLPETGDLSWYMHAAMG